MPIAELPSALEAFDEMVPLDTELAVFLDYDGTLTPIVDRPEDATLPEEVRSILRRLARTTPVVLVSGREREELSRLVGIDELGSAGSHGFDIRGPAGSALRHEVGTDALPLLDRAEDELRGSLSGFPGVLIERKRFGVATHFRLASTTDRKRIVAAVREIHERTPGLRLEPGKMVLELRPDIDWDKGKAVVWLLEKLGWEKRFPIHIGDDLTDETVFTALETRGLGILVGGTNEQETRARLHLADPAEVRRFLEKLADRR